MIGGSYDGTTANMVAARGADAPGLAAIVPELAISRWYGYAYADGVRYLGNSERPDRRGLRHAARVRLRDRAHAADPAHAADVDAMRDRMNPCDARRAHAKRLRHARPTTTASGCERDYRKDAAQLPRLDARRARLAGLQRQAVRGRRPLRGAAAADDRLGERAVQAALPVPGRAPVAVRAAALRRAARRVLRHHAARARRPGPELAAPVLTQGRTRGRPGEFRDGDAPGRPPARATQRLALGRGLGGGTLGGRGAARRASFTDRGTTTEETALRAPGRRARAGSPTSSAPLARRHADRRHAAAASSRSPPTPTTASSRRRSSTSRPTARAKAISRGFLNLRYRNGLRDDEAVPPGRAGRARRCTFSPQDHTVAKGHRIGLIVAGSNMVWAVPDAPRAPRPRCGAGRWRCRRAVAARTAADGSGDQSRHRFARAAAGHPRAHGHLR